MSRARRPELPREAKIPPAERREWLRRHEEGGTFVSIAREARRNPRTVTAHIEKARLERDFESAQSGQLREALRSHQQDMQELLRGLQQCIHVPDHRVDFSPGCGLENLVEPEQFHNYSEAGIGPLWTAPRGSQDRYPMTSIRSSKNPHAITMTRDLDGPKEVKITEEGTRLWRALKEHIGRDPLWRHLSDWKSSLLRELLARADLNRATLKEAEEQFELKVVLNSPVDPKEPHLTHSFVPWLRTQVTRRALGEPVNISEQIQPTQSRRGDLVLHDGTEIVRRIEYNQNDMVQLLKTFEAVVDIEETKTAAKTYKDLLDSTQRVQDAVEEHLLIHHIPGRCRLCKKLGG